MLLYMGLSIILGCVADIMLYGFLQQHILIMIAGVCLVVWGVGIPFAKRLLSNSKLAFASGIFIRLLLILLLIGVYYTSSSLLKNSTGRLDSQVAEAFKLMDKKDYTKAYDSLKTLSEKNPDNTDIKRDMALLYMEQKRGDEAIKIFNEILAKKPYDTGSRLGLVKYLEDKKDWKNARNEAKKIILYDPHNSKAYIEIGDSFWEEADLIRSIHYYSLAVREDAGSVDAHYKLGTAYYKTHSFGEALEELHKARELASSETQRDDITKTIKALAKEIDESAAKQPAGAASSKGGI